MPKILVLAVIMTVAGGAHAAGSGFTKQSGSGNAKSGLISKSERNRYIAKASLWVPEELLNTRMTNFKRSPFSSPWYHPEELVTCRYIATAEAYKAGKPNGVTPKFKCRDMKGRTLKVKYGQKHIEAVTEVAASWVLTAIGAYADRMYPVMLDCPDCPSDPFVSEEDRGSWISGRQVAIEDKIGKRLETTPNSGIGFDEFYRIEDRVGAEALTGLIHFLANTDNKAANQAIACLDKGGETANGTAGCLKPIVYLQDLGVGFGGRRRIHHNSRMNYDAWGAEPLWTDPARCVLHMRSIPGSSMREVDSSGRNLHQIGETARQMLVKRLSLLSRDQLIDIFTAARAPRQPPEHSAEQWADLFLQKVEMLRYPLGGKTGANFACPYEVVPENSNINTDISVY